MGDLPSFLSPLLEDTRGTRLKLLAAWDGLPVDLQIGLLDALGESRVPRELALKALASPNAYVRYLAAGPAYDWWSYEIRRRPEGDGDADAAGVEGKDSRRPWRDVLARLQDDPDPLAAFAQREHQRAPTTGPPTRRAGPPSCLARPSRSSP